VKETQMAKERFWLMSQNSRGNRRDGGLQVGTPVSVNGWAAGVKIIPTTGATDGKERFQVYMTYGSEPDGRRDVYLGTVRSFGAAGPVWDTDPDTEYTRTEDLEEGWTTS
jgi:hypothetical protein